MIHRFCYLAFSRAGRGVKSRPDETSELARNRRHRDGRWFAGSEYQSLKAPVEAALSTVCERNSISWFPFSPALHWLSDRGSVSVVPCGFNKDASNATVSCLGDTPSSRLSTTTALARDEPEVRHQ